MITPTLSQAFNLVIIIMTIFLILYVSPAISSVGALGIHKSKHAIMSHV